MPIPRKPLLLSAGVVALLALAGGIFFWLQRPKTFRSALAAALQVDPGTLTINFPPAYGRYPGALLLRGDHGQLIPISQVDRPDSSRSLPFDIDAAYLSSGDLALAGNADVLSEALAMNDKVRITVTLKHGRVFEKTAANLKTLLTENDEVEAILKKGRSPEIISRAYEALVEIHIQRKTSVEEKDWVQLKKDAAANTDTAGLRLSVKAEDEVVLTTNQPICVAYETLTSEWIANNLSTSGQPQLVLHQKTNNRDTLQTTRLGDFGLRPAGDSILVVPLVSAKYQGIHPASIPFAEPSARLLTSTLQTCGAAVLETDYDPSATPLTADRIHDIFNTLKKKLASHRYSSVLYYYVGHAYTSNADSILLVLGNYDPDQPAKGIYGLVDLYNAADSLGLPFALLVDGCFGSDRFDELRQFLHLTATGDYYGSEDKAYASITRYAEQQRNFPRKSQTSDVFPELAALDKIDRFLRLGYLVSDNPVLFAAKPGDLAYPVGHPSMVLGNEVAPLARRAAWELEVDISRLQPVPFGAFLQSMVDFTGTGQITGRGTCSWSSFEELNKMRMIDAGQ